MNRAYLLILLSALASGCAAPPIPHKLTIRDARVGSPIPLDVGFIDDARTSSAQIADVEWSGSMSVDAEPQASQVRRPSIEVCDGRDNDIDGFIDEGFDVGLHCYDGDGRCARQGVVLCNESGLSSCQSLGSPIGSSDEVCNGADDDCDGRVDEHDPRIGDGCETGFSGLCGIGLITCNQGQIGCLPPHPDREVCDYLDNDCDGVTDEGVTNRCGGCGPAPAEVINGGDDDCDGLVDEGRLDGPCNDDRDCVGELMCLDGVCGADCPSECDDCEECVANWIWEDGQPLIGPDDCESVCDVCLSGCASVGGVCVDRICRRDANAVKCTPDATPFITTAPTFKDDMLEDVDVTICERP